MVAHWARRTRRAVQAALLATPPDFETPMPAGYPSLEALSAGGWLPVPRERLPFRSIVAASRDDPLASCDRVAGAGRGLGQRVRRPRCGRSPQPGVGLRRMAGRRRAHRSAVATRRGFAGARSSSAPASPATADLSASPRSPRKDDSHGQGHSIPPDRRPRGARAPDRRGRRARARARRACATATSRSTSSTSTFAPGAIRCRCPTGSAAMRSASSRRSARASPTSVPATASATCSARRARTPMSA